MARPEPTYGGQAVIEGVLMRGARSYSVAVRAPDRSIQIQTKPLGSLQRSKLVRLPFIRGLLILWDSLSVGVRALAYSANVQAQDESERIEGSSLTLALLGSLAIGVFLFLLVPAGAADLIQRLIGIGPLTTNLIEGALRLALLVAYVWGIGRVPEIERVYGYHGAEHMTIHAHEAGTELSVEHVSSYPTAHPRCGTAFLLTVVVLSILLFSLLGPLPLALRLGSRILFIPVLASLAYEYIRLTARLSRYRVARILAWPNLALQRLTTRPPSPEMLEVAIASFRSLRESEQQLEPEPA